MTASILLYLASWALLLATIANERAMRRGGITFHRIGRYCVTISKSKER
jgi:hypothetical protein